jgi:hypothetical protein
MSGTEIPVGFRFKEKNSSKIGNRDKDGRFFSDGVGLESHSPKIKFLLPYLNLINSS